MAMVATWPALTSAAIMLGLLWLSVIAFAVLGGADFGAGIWDLLASGRTTDPQRAALVRAIGPIWEANEIWLIFLITGLFTAFPIVFATLSIALFVPLTVALIGTVLRGAAFAYYSHFRPEPPVDRGWGRIFSLFSLLAPFAFGVSAGTVASGRILPATGNEAVAYYFTPWLRPFPLVCGLFAVCMCALLAAVYMVVETRNAREPELVEVFRGRALLAYAITAVVGAVAIVLAVADAPTLWRNLTGRGLILVVGTMLLGVTTIALLLARLYALARIAVAGTVGGIFLGWGVAQFPYLVPPRITLDNASSPPAVQGALLIGTLIGMALVLPALWYMLRLFKARHRRMPYPSAETYLQHLPDPPASPDPAPGMAPPNGRPHGAPADIGAALALVAGALIVSALRHRRPVGD